MRAPRVRYPLHDLEELIGWPTAAQLAEVFGVKPQTISQWRQRGLSHERADEMACRFGHHPALVWPNWLDYAFAEPGTPEKALRPKRRTRSTYKQPSSYIEPPVRVLT